MSDKTYSETVGEKPFDWWHALDHPQEFPPDYLADKAAEWTTCACGNQCAIIPRTTYGDPIDQLLMWSGAKFYSDVENQHWEDAKLTLRRIEARSAILIAEELAKLNAP